MKKVLTYLTEKKISREEHKLVNEAMGYFEDDFDNTINLVMNSLPVKGTIEEIRETARVFKDAWLSNDRITKSGDRIFRWAPELEEQLRSFGLV